MSGALLYAIGDVLLLAPAAAEHTERRLLPVDVSGDGVLRRRVALLEELARLPYWRLRWGGLLGVIGAPLTLGGLWLFYRAVEPAGSWLVVPPAILFLTVTVVGPFVHGSFAYLGDTVHALFLVSERDRPVLVDMLRRQLVMIQIAYAPLLLAAILASVWTAFAVLSGRTRFPAWMAAVNPVTLTIAWLLLKRALPTRIGSLLQGAGFNIAYFAWFASMTAMVR